MSDPIHEVNDDERLELDASVAADYVRFFMYFLRADNDPFILFEHVPESAKDNPKAIALARPLASKGTDSAGSMLFDGTVIYAGTVFNAVLKLAKTGQIEMLDDDPVESDFDPARLPGCLSSRSLQYSTHVSCRSCRERHRRVQGRQRARALVAQGLELARSHRNRLDRPDGRVAA